MTQIQRSFDLGPRPRTPIVRFVRADGTSSAWYIAGERVLVTPEDVTAVEIRQLPNYPEDYPAGDDPSWLAKDGGPADIGEAEVVRPEVRGPEHFRGGGA